MTKRILVLSIMFLVACGEKRTSINSQTPVADQYLNASLGDFQQALVSYYGLTDSGVFKVCQLDPYFCDDYVSLENYIRSNYVE